MNGMPASIGPDQATETELKFAIPASRTTVAISLLEKLCKPDPTFPAGIVSSIYFDTRDWTYLGEKRNSDYLKTKVRLRWYEPFDSPATDDPAFAEVKTKTGTKRSKTRVQTAYTGAALARMDLADKELLQIPEALIAAGAAITQPLVPAFTVRYRRRRYVERSSGDRVAIDYAITAPKVNRRMLARSRPCELGLTILEIKGTRAKFPPGLMPVFNLGFRRDAFSKYYECYRRLSRTIS